MPITSSSQRCVWRAAGAGAAPQRRSLRARCAAHKGGERPLAPSSSSEAGVATSTRRLALSLLGVAGLGAALPATALGPENVDLEIVDYQTVECAEGVPKGARCVQFKAIGNNKSKKAAYNGEIFGKVRYAGSNESAIYGDFAEVRYFSPLQTSLRSPTSADAWNLPFPPPHLPREPQGHGRR